MMIEITLLIILILLLLSYFYLTNTFNYWKDKHVIFIKPYPIVGSLTFIFSRTQVIEFCNKIYKKYEDQPYIGIFMGMKPGLMIRDPNIIKRILVKDFNHFTDHGFAIDEDIDPLQTRNLFNMNGYTWKEMRAKLTPTFTTGRIKAMFPLALERAETLEKYLDKYAADNNADLNIKDMMARFTTDVISICAFGIKNDSIHDPNNLFRKMGKKVFETSITQALKILIIFISPELGKYFDFHFFATDVEKFFRTIVKDVIDHRKTTGEIRNDFMQLLIELKDKGYLTIDCEKGEKDEINDDLKYGDLENVNVNYKLDEEDVTAQAVLFFNAGFDTTSNVLNYAFFELSQHPEIQEKARKQIQEVLNNHNGEVTFDSLKDMTYLDFILQETLRHYPPIPMINRVCTKNYKIPETDLLIEEDVAIVIPFRSLHFDPKYYPNPEEYNPDRFDKIENANDSYLPFGVGPRQCIGLRFARMVSKLALLHILRNYQIKPSTKTKVPIVFDPRQLQLITKDDIYIKLSYLNNQ